MQLLDAIAPSATNSYRPYLLRKNALAFFLAVILMSEGLFVASLFKANPSQMFFAAVAQAPASAEEGGAVANLDNWIKSFARMASSPQTASAAVLMLVAAVVLALIAAAVLMYTHIQPSDIILPALVVVGIALILLALNMWYGGTYGIA